VVYVHLDNDLVFSNGTWFDYEPLMINTANSSLYRPNAFTEIPNLFLAADYVTTFADIADMDTANEAGRRASNAILNSEGRNDTATTTGPIWPDGLPFEAARELDKLLYESGEMPLGWYDQPSNYTKLSEY